MDPTLPPLDRIDPAQAWQPWKPEARDPWGRKWAAHLYRRAAFGANRAELLEAERKGPEATLDLLLRGGPEANEVLPVLTTAGEHAARDGSGHQLRGWWLYCMLQGSHPLREKMTLFWHNHFATSMAKVQSGPLMYRQNCLLRKHALGKFGPFLQDISKDGAMLVWLDSNSNVKAHPNENYAREVMELFSLGVGNYKEKDIREAARAFTGWHTDGEGFEFNARVHDTGSKTVLGQTGNWNGDDVVRILLTQPAAGRFLVRKLYRFFIGETAEPPAALLEPLAESFRKSDYDIAALLRTMLSSRLFYSGHAFRQRIKSPVEFVLGAVRAVYRAYDEKDPNYKPLLQQVLVGRIDAMGQELFAPPNVKGWPGARAWLNTSTLLARDNFAQALAMGTLWNENPQVVFTNDFTECVVPEPPGPEKREEQAPPTAYDPARLIHEEKATRPEDVGRILLDLYLPGGVRPEAQAKLTAFLAAGKPAGAALDRRVREAVHAVLCMPEYQLA
jgi:uncharacterized protein (DUF1800 family)